VCSHCAKKRESDLHPYTTKLLQIISLQNAGYPFGADDLTLEEWHDLGHLRKQLEQNQKRSVLNITPNRDRQ
jgi:hypothetical protein